MNKLEIGFEWSRGRYAVATLGGAQAIRQVDKTRESFRPLEFETTKPLYARFAQLDGSVDGCLEFASAWGLLENPAPATKAESIDGWRRAIRNMRGLITMFDVSNVREPGGVLRKRTGASVQVIFKAARIEACLFGNPAGRPTLVLQPSDLLNAMLLQLAVAVASGKSIKTCPQCQEWFQTGDEARRSMSIFCSTTCKNRYDYLKRRTGK